MAISSVLPLQGESLLLHVIQIVLIDVSILPARRELDGLDHRQLQKEWEGTESRSVLQYIS